MDQEAKDKLKPTVQKKEVKFSEKELKELMGTGRPVYRRHKGSLRQK